MDEAAEADKAAEADEADEAGSGSRTMTELRQSPKKHASSADNADGDNDDATSRAKTRRGAASSSGAASSGGAPIAEEAVENADAVCNVCNKGDNVAALLLCDNCDNATHTTCCLPPLESVPLTDWYCSTCKSAGMICLPLTASQKRRRRRQRHLDDTITELQAAKAERDQLKVSGLNFRVELALEPTTEDIANADSVYAQTSVFTDEDGIALTWAAIAELSDLHQDASLLSMHRNDELVGVASAITTEILPGVLLVVLENFAIMPQHQSRGLATIFSELILPQCDIIGDECGSVEVIRMPQLTNEYAALTAGFVKATKRVTARYLKHLTHVTGLEYDAYDKKAQQYAIGSVYSCAR